MANKFTFREYQDSALDAGEYTVRADQNLTVTNKHGTGTLNETLLRTLIVQGKRFALDAQDVQSMFPAPGGAGDFTAVMPHIILNAKSLPWQRSPDGVPRNSSPNYPWLALLVFNESDGIPVQKKMTLQELYENRAGLAPWIRKQDGTDIGSLDDFLEYGENADDPVTVIDLSRQSLQALLPSPADMALLAHARGPEDSYDELQSVLVANRLPKSGERHSAHLVSLMYALNTIDPTNAAQVSLVGTGADFRLVSLYSWTFYCEDTGDFKEYLKNLDKNLLRLPTPEAAPAAIAAYFEQSFTVLPHHLRVGRDVASLYRGPLLGGQAPASPVALPVESADALLLYDRKSGMLEVSYAAAWTLGRQLALEDRTFALDLYKYKRRNSIKSSRKDQADATGAGSIRHLAVGKNTFAEDDPTATDETKEKIETWLKQYETLQNIPFHYLVPQEALLPEESIRFFQLDTNWIACLQHGALGIGGDLSNGAQIRPSAAPKYWGFYLRSRVVAEFPKLRIEGFSDKKTDLEDRVNPIAPVEIRRIQENMLFVYFDTAVQTVDIFLDPSTLFFGFRETAEKALVKDLKTTEGRESGADIAVIAADWRDEQARILNVSTWAGRMQAQLLPSDPEFEVFTSADFALQMVEGAPRVRFFVTGV